MAAITVIGRAEVSVPPDEATLTLTVESVRPSATDALDDVAGRASVLLDLLDELGVGAGDRSTSGVSVGEAGERDGQGNWQHRGYRAIERLTVTVRDAATIGRLLGEAVERAQASVEGPRWSVSPSNPARTEALQAAAADARPRGEAVAAGLGVRLGAVVEVVEAGATRPEPRGGAMRAMSADVPIEAGEATVTATVSVTFQIEQG